MKFRYDINALRALAVLGVVIFHYNSSWMSGGFAGVDVFFVITGYLMTGIMLERFSTNSFSFTAFYAARIKRIVPGLAALCLFLLAFGYFFLVPLDYKGLGEQIYSSLLFFSNFLFWGQAGYFDLESHEKWLLHTWSLSVEWQFYLLYPIALLALVKVFSRESLNRALLVLLIAAFALAVWLSLSHPMAGYYLLPTRGWEMLAGAYAYVFRVSFKDGVRLALQLIGLLLIIASYFVVSGTNIWPGYMAAFPVLGSFLILIAARDSSGLVRNSLVQRIGLYSYSIYLWHWVVLVFMRKFAIDLDGHLSLPFSTDFMLYLVLSIVAAGLSYHFVEKAKLTTTTVILLSAMVISCGYYVAQNGMADRVSSDYAMDAKTYHQVSYGGSGFPAKKYIYFNSVRGDFDHIFVGDSYGLQYASVIDESELKVAGLFANGCPILPNYSRSRYGEEDLSCSDQFGRVVKRLKENKSAPLFFLHSWDKYQRSLMAKGSDFTGPLDFVTYDKILRKEFEAIRRIGGNDRVYVIVGVHARTNFNVYECLGRNELIGFRLHSPCPTTQEQSPIPINETLRDIALSHKNVIYVDPSDAICKSGRCLLSSDGRSYYSDKTHFSKLGAKIVMEHVLAEVLPKIEAYD